MEKGYFNKNLTSEEISLVRYISNYVNYHSKTNISVLRLAKIVVHCTLKLKLPIRMYWYRLGITPAAQPQAPTTYDFEFEKGSVIAALGTSKIEDLNRTIDESISIFTEKLSGEEIRRKQYELLDDKLYLTILDLQQLCNKGELLKSRDRFLDLVAELLINIPDNLNYVEVHIIIHDFSVLANSLLYDCDVDKKIDSDLKNSLLSIIEYITILNAKFRTISGYEKLFIRDVEQSLINQKLWEAKNSLIALQNDVSQKIKKDLIPQNFGTNLEKELFFDSLNFFVN